MKRKTMVVSMSTWTRGVDDVQDEGVDHNSSALISQLRDEVAYLRDENRRKDEIIMQQAMTMRQITAASQEPSEPPESEASPAPTATPNRAGAEAQEATEQAAARPVDGLPLEWWILGGALSVVAYPLAVYL